MRWRTVTICAAGACLVTATVIGLAWKGSPTVKTPREGGPLAVAALAPWPYGTGLAPQPHGLQLTDAEKQALVDEFYAAFAAKARFLGQQAIVPDCFDTAVLRFTPADKAMKEIAGGQGPLRSVTLSNAGREATVGRISFYTSRRDAAAAEALATEETPLAGVTDQDLACYLFRLVRDNHYRQEFSISDGCSPQGLLRSYGAGRCGQAASVLAKLALEFGLKARVTGLAATVDKEYPDGHTVTEIQFRDGTDEWHMFDPDMGHFFLERIEPETYRIPSAEDVKADPSVVTDTLGGHERTPLGLWTVARLTAFHAAARIAITEPLERRAGSLSPRYVNALALLTDPLFGDTSMPVSFNFRLEPGDLLEVSNIPGGQPPLQNLPQCTPKFYANGRLIASVRDSRLITAFFPIIFVEQPCSGLTFTVPPQQASEPDEWSAPARSLTPRPRVDARALNELLASLPAYHLAAYGRGRLVAATFCLSPFILGRENVRFQCVKMDVQVGTPDVLVELKWARTQRQKTDV